MREKPPRRRHHPFLSPLALLLHSRPLPFITLKFERESEQNPQFLLAQLLVFSFLLVLGFASLSMGNYRFKFSHMIPNAWFYKLKDTGKAMRSSTAKKTTTRETASSSSLAQAKATEPKPRCQPGRASYYFPSRQEKLPSSPVRLGSSDSAFSNTMSMKKTHKKRQTLLTVAECGSTEINSGAARRTEKLLGFPGGDDDYEGIPCAVKPVISEHNKPGNPPISEIDGSESIQAISRSSSCRFTSSATDIILDMSRKNSRSREIQEKEDILKVQELVLPPILTKPVKSRDNRGKKHSEPGSTSLYRERRKSVKLQGRRVRALSPRLSLKTVRHKKFLTESFAVAKSSSDPGRDFRESMMEMIAAKDIRASNDMEDLLACYLSLNSSEYHAVIVKVFEQIWFDLTKLRLRDIS